MGHVARSSAVWLHRQGGERQDLPGPGLEGHFTEPSPAAGAGARLPALRGRGNLAAVDPGDRRACQGPRVLHLPALGQMPAPAGRHADPFSMVGNPLPTSLTKGIPIIELSRWLGHKSIEVPTRSTATSSPAPGTAPATPSTMPTRKAKGSSHPANGAESVLTPRRPICHLPAQTAHWSTITQIYQGTNQIQRMVMARQLIKE